MERDPLTARELLGIAAEADGHDVVVDPFGLTQRQE